MATIAEQLTSLANTKTAIKDAIVAKGVQVADDTPFIGYADKIGEISGGGEPVEKTKFGVGIDNFIGDVDSDGILYKPETKFALNLSGLNGVYNNAFSYAFYQNKNITEVDGAEITFVRTSAFHYAFYGTPNLKTVRFDNIETIGEGSSSAFYGAFGDYTSKTHNSIVDISFIKLKEVTASSCFREAFKNVSTTKYVSTVDEIFPSLEIIGGSQTFDGFVSYYANFSYTFSHIKKITGGTATYYSTFGGLYVKGTVWNFPSATEFTGYIWNIGTSYPGEIHFAAANQAAIEACDGYANKWGFAGATIYFDL
jgi:hypothetical protein